MKILYVTFHGGSGGISTLIRELVNSFKSISNVQIDVCYSSFIGTIGNDVSKIADNTSCLYMRNGYDFLRAIKIIKIIKEGQYDVVHLHYFTPILRLLTFLARPNLIIQTEHGGIKGEIGSKRWIIMKFIHRLLAKTADFYTTVSDDSKNDLLKYRLTSPDKLKVIYNGINVEKFKPCENCRNELRNQLEIKNNEFVIGTVRGLIPKMGIDHLLYSLKYILPEIDNIKALIIGKGPLEMGLKNLSNKLGLKDYVIFLGERNDIPKCLSAMDIFVMPSVWETFGIAAVEAMSVGVPVVAYAVGGLVEVIENNVNGVLVYERNPEMLGAEILGIIKSKEKIDKYRKNGQKRAKEYFNIDLTAERYINLYTELLNN